MISRIRSSLARQLGATAFSYTPVLPIGRGKNCAGPGWSLDGRQVLQAEESLATRYRGFLSVLTQEQQSELDGGKSCGAGYRTYTMDPWGYIRPCAMYGPKDIIIGDLKNQGVEEVFGNPVTRALAKFPLPNRETCAGCKREMFCSHCGLRGIQGSRLEPNCGWLRQPAVQEVLRHCSSARI